MLYFASSEHKLCLEQIVHVGDPSERRWFGARLWWFMKANLCIFYLSRGVGDHEK